MSEQATLIKEFPEAHVTQDIDVFLSLQLWTNPERAIAFRTMLTRIGYEVARHNWHFRKPYPDMPDRFVSLELQARTPHKEEPVNLRDGQVGKGMGTGVAGYHTPEAFAVDESPLQLIYADAEGRVRVPHPYTWLNLKVAAAYDWLREKNGEIEAKVYRETGISRRLKHVYDVYVLVAMLTEQEQTEARELAHRYAKHPVAMEILKKAATLYADHEGEGMRAVELYARQSVASTLRIDHELFWEEGLKPVLGIPS